MATYYVWSGAGGSATGADWTNAFLTLGAAITAATSNGDVIKVHNTHTETLGATTTYSAANNISIICVDKNNSDALSAMDNSTGYIRTTSTTTAYTLTITANTNYRMFMHGLAFQAGGTSNNQVNFGSSAGSVCIFEACKFWVTNTSSTTYHFQLGPTSNSFAVPLFFNGCDFKFGNTGQTFRPRATRVRFNECSINSSGSAPSTLFSRAENLSDSFELKACDLSHVTGTLIADNNIRSVTFIFVNCKLGSGVTVLASQTFTNQGSAEAILYNCSSDDTHYHVAHYDALGATVCSSSIYVADGAEYNTTGDKYSWKIVTTGGASYFNPYTSPWINKHNETLSAITPYLECMRDNSSGAVFRNDEVWAEFSYQGTTGYPLGVFVNDRMTLLGTPADQTASSKTAADWAGETGTPGFFKIGPASSITPAEIGPLSARVCVGKPSVTVYVDPQIRT